jgi:hypothetical protein
VTALSEPVVEVGYDKRRPASGQARSRASYPTKAAIKRIIETARLCGIGVIEVFPDGRIRFLDKVPALREPANDFDRLEAAGLI